MEVYCDVTHRRCAPSSGRFDHLEQVNTAILADARAAVAAARLAAASPGADAEQVGGDPGVAAAAAQVADAEQIERVLHFLRTSTGRIFSVIDRITSRAEGARVYEATRGVNQILRVIQALNPDSEARMDAIRTARDKRMSGSYVAALASVRASALAPSCDTLTVILSISEPTTCCAPSKSTHTPPHDPH